MIDIYLTSFFRKEFTDRCINLIHERTAEGTFGIHIYDNGSDGETRKFLIGLLEQGKIVSLHLDSRNTGCLYNKTIFQSMTETKNKYYVVSDNDIYPPKLTPDWLSQMIAIMEKYPNIAMLTPQFPPIVLMGPLKINDDVVYCEAVGNAFKVVRRDFFPSYEQKLMAYGDDGQLSALVRSRGYDVAFCRNIFCMHAGQCDNWGYKPEEILQDPRKSGYGRPYVVPLDLETYMPLDQGQRL